MTTPAEAGAKHRAQEYERIPTRIRAVEFWPEVKPWPLNVRQRSRETCSDPQCGDSTWDHECDLGEPIDEWFVYNGLHKSAINLQPGDFVRVDDPNDTYPIDRATFEKTYRVPTPEPVSDEQRAKPGEPGWYECRLCCESQKGRIVRWFDGRSIRQSPGDSAAYEAIEYTDFIGPLVPRAELTPEPKAS